MDLLLKHEPGFFIWEFIIFIIFLIILKRMASKPLLAYLKERRNKIADSLASAEKIKSEMMLLKQEHEIMKAKVYEEIADMNKEVREYTNTILAEAKIKAKEEYERAFEEARACVAKMRTDAVNDIKRKTGALIIQIAAEVLRNSLTEKQEQEDHIRRLIGNINFNKD